MSLGNSIPHLACCVEKCHSEFDALKFHSDVWHMKLKGSVQQKNRIPPVPDLTDWNVFITYQYLEEVSHDLMLIF